MIKIHSEVALITNSSTVIYSNATGRTIEKAKVLINAILAETAMAKLGTTADDLYDFALEWDQCTIDRAYEQLAEYPERYGIDPAIAKEAEDDYSQALLDIAIARLNGGWVPLEEYGRINCQNLVVTDKDGNVVSHFNAFLYSLQNEAVDG
jgi:hypothetical protein